MKVRSFKECKRIARGHWSVRFHLVAIAFSFGEATLPSAQPYLPTWINPLGVALAIGVCTAGGLFCKIVLKQEGIDAAD